MSYTCAAISWRAPVYEDTWQPIVIPLAALAADMDLNELSGITIHFGNSYANTPLNSGGQTFLLDGMRLMQKKDWERPVIVQ